MSKPEKKYVDVEIDMPDDTFLALAKMAHEKDITFNQMCEEALRAMIAHYEKKSQEG